jgi:hypothetical protein
MPNTSRVTQPQTDRKQHIRNGALILNLCILAIALGHLLGCKTSWQSDSDAKGALNALKRLQSRTEVGITSRDYSVALGETNFAVKQFLDTDVSKDSADFDSSIREALKWYSAASEVWSAETQNPYAHPTSSTCRDAMNSLCQDHPELVVTVSGFSHSEPGINYAVARDESWQFASFFVRNATHAMKGEALEDFKPFQMTVESTLRKHIW